MKLTGKDFRPSGFLVLALLLELKNKSNITDTSDNSSQGLGRPNLNHWLWPYSLFSVQPSLPLTSFFLFFSMFWNLDSSFSCSALMRFASSRSRFVCSCSKRSIVCFCCFSRFSISWSYCRFLLC